MRTRRDPAVTFFSFRDSGCLLGIGAIKRLGPDHAEIKSMHTAQAARGRAIGRAMLTHLLGVARSRGYRQVSLETGTTAAFAPAGRCTTARASPRAARSAAISRAKTTCS
jgi:putative acetyltransferase